MVPVRIDLLLDVRKQIGNVLHLIEDGGRRIRFQECERIVQRGRLNVRKLQRDVSATLAEKPLQERRLARLAGSGQDDGGKLGDRRLSTGSRERSM